MEDNRYAEDRWIFIDKIQGWFQHKSQFWLSLSIICLGAILVLEAISVFASQANPDAWQRAEFLMIPLLVIFIMSIFWRSIVHSVLAFTGALITIYPGAFLFHAAKLATPFEASSVADRLGYGIKHTSHVDPHMLANLHFVVGGFVLIFCLAIAIKPDFFRSKNYDGLPYPVWKGSRDCGNLQNSKNVRLIALSALLSFEERHAIARYKFVVVAIGGRKYLVTPYDWIPQNAVVIRDDSSNSIVGFL